MGWDLKQLREDVERLFGREQRDLLSPCLNSIVDRQYYARFHFQEGIRLIKEFIEHRDDQVSLTLLVVGANPQEQEEFCVQRKQTEAHVVACMQSMHALSDTLGHVLYFATGGNLDPKRRLDLWKVSGLCRFVWNGRWFWRFEGAVMSRADAVRAQPNPLHCCPLAYASSGPRKAVCRPRHGGQ